MLTEVMRHYGLSSEPVDAGYFETDHHEQIHNDLKAAILNGRLVALTAVIGSGKTLLIGRLREALEKEGKVIIARSLSLDKTKITAQLLDSALFYDLSTEKTVKIPTDSEKRARELQTLFRKAKKPVVLFIDDAHDLHPKTLTSLKRLFELAPAGKGKISIVLIGHPKLKNDLRRPSMEEVGDRTTVFEFGGLRDCQRDYIDWVMRSSLNEGVEISDVITDEAATLLASRLKTPLQIGRYLVRAFETGFDLGVKPVDSTTVEAVLSRRFDDMEPLLTRHGYDIHALCSQFDAKPPEIRQLMRGTLNPQRSNELVEEMRAAGLPL
jgi:type II secretory pathway predicted ATPase ExeA